ncbi:Zn(2)-C6 fungal-type DNA-binding domain [Fusarium oxysporum f. sp. vasinfectum]|nr:Zn(2)-C6 fungal-type DNA-binding domain [Fusarium oxysporum f. sp. vasinfectum]
MALSRPLPKCVVACRFCRDKKVKCSGTHPCANCVTHQQSCKYPEKTVRTRRQRAPQRSLEARLASVELLLTQSAQKPWSSSQVNGLSPQPPNKTTPQEQQPHPIQTQPFSHTTETVPDAMPESTVCVAEPRNTASPTGGVALGHAATNSPGLTDGGRSESSDRQLVVQARTTEEPSLPPQDTPLEMIHATSHSFSVANDDPINLDWPLVEPVMESPIRADQDQEHKEAEEDDHRGIMYEVVSPGVLSICSSVSSDWICNRLGNQDFHASACNFSATMTRRLRLGRRLGGERAADPDYETAKKWTQAFFEESIEHAWGLVPRRAFEMRLEHHYKHSCPQIYDQNVSWYALRNIVFAIGARLALSPTRLVPSLMDAQKQSWPFFENAFSVQVDLMYMPSGNINIEILLLMMFYCEGITSPKLSYMLLGCATRLAQSKGLHLMPAAYTHVSESEDISRKYLWWIIYVHDKTTSLITARPSVISDKDTSVGLPTMARPDTATDLTLFVNTIKLAQIVSVIVKKLIGPNERRKSYSKLADLTARLESDLQIWQAGSRIEDEEIPSSGSQSNHFRVRSTMRLELKLCYYCAVCALHGTSRRPWEVPPEQEAEYLAHVQERWPKIAEASRSLITLCQPCQINAATPARLAIYYPLVAVINLFINVLERPTAQSATADVNLIDMMTGTFARLEYATSGHLNITFPRELADFARGLVSRLKDSPPDTSLSSYLPIDLEMSLAEYNPNIPLDQILHLWIVMRERLWIPHFPKV